MDPSAVLRASVGGSAQLLALTAAGALSAHLGHWTSHISSAMSNTIYKICTPALIFFPVLTTLSEARHALTSADGPRAMQAVLIPLLIPFPILAATALIAIPLAAVLARGRPELVRRVVTVCLLMGNAYNLVLLVMQSMCDTLPQFHNDHSCFARATAFNALYAVPVMVIDWSVIFPYITSVSMTEDNNTPLVRTSQDESSQNTQPSAIRRSLLSPPTLTVVAASLISLIPGMSELFIPTNAVLHPLVPAVNSVGMVAVYTSSFIVGAEVHAALTKQKNTEPTRSILEDTTTDDTYKIGGVTIVSVAIVRMGVIPFLARLVFATMGVTSKIIDPVLSAFVLSETNTVTANMAMIFVTLATADRRGGKRLRRDVATLLLLQYVLAPVILTLNSAWGLGLVFSR